MYFQKQPRMDTYFKKSATGNWSMPAHLHSFFEIYCCTQGTLPIQVGSRSYILEPGQALFIFPYQPHSFPIAEDGNGYLFTFDPALIGSFADHYANYQPRENLFSFSTDPADISADDNLFAIKAFLYSMCADASRQLEFDYAPADSRVLLGRIFTLTEENFTNPSFSLRTLADMLTYDYGYISKYFLQKTGMRYNSYLNQRRIVYAGRLLRKSEARSISDAAFACGYSTIRSFNRNFKQVYGMTPQEYIE